MFYVSAFNRKSKMYGVTDTADGVTEWFSKESILGFPKDIKIQGVSGKTIKVVNAASGVAQKEFDKFEDIVRNEVAGWTEEECMAVARKASFVRKIKGLPADEMHRVVVENIYPQNIRDAVAQAADFSNQLIEVNVSDKGAVINALRGNVCLVLQHKTNGVLTSFMCTGSLSVSDAVYEPYFFDCVYLTKQLYNYTYNLDKVRPKREGSKEKNPSMLNVFSSALRFRMEGKNHDGANKELSSPFYTINLDKILGMYILAEPQKLGDRILPEFYMTARKDTYNFDFEMYNEVKQSVVSGQNMFLDKAMFMKYVDTDTLSHAVEVTDVINRFNDDFEYMKYLRSTGYSFK